jgi:predicted transposase YbfD/YdcC
MLSGAEDYVTIAEYGSIKREWFESLLSLPNGIPSHDTFQRVFARLDPEQLRLCLMEWADVLRQQCSTDGEEVVALDGKTLRRSFDAAAGKGAIHIVSAWASKARLSLGQIKVDDKSNEITAVPALLKLLDVKGCIVTADAMHCQKATARQITEQGGTFVLALKGNQSTLAEDVKLLAEHAQQHKYAGLRTRTCTDNEKDHGRMETRTYRLIQLPEGIAWQDERKEWHGLKSIGMVKSTRTTAKGTSTETRLYITAIDGEPKDSARRFATAVRYHWGIENSLHWTLDVCFREDDCRVRKDNGPQNLAVLRHLALNLLKRDTTTKAGIKTRRLKAGWDNAYLEHLLTN